MQMDIVFRLVYQPIPSMCKYENIPDPEELLVPDISDIVF